MHKNFIPFKFKPNRVKRLYRGGLGLDLLCRKTKVADNNFPEDWIASCIEANTREFIAPGHGQSICFIGGKEYSFPKILNEHPKAMLGAAHFNKYGANPGVLTKLLDSAVLLPMQVHPDLDCSRRFFNSSFGKTEAWIILSTREINGEKPYILLGFNEQLNEQQFKEESLKGQFKISLEMLHKIEVKPGDVFVVYGRMPHAIGPGITMVEVMEPTDYVIIPEKNCFEIELDYDKRFAGLAPDKAMDIFDFTPLPGKAIIQRCCPDQFLIEKNDSGTLHRIISRKKEKFFEAQRLRFKGEWQMDLSLATFRIGLVTDGEAVLKSSSTLLTLRAGDSFFIPYDTADCSFSGSAEVFLILPPESTELS
jgi:mannose-6-phosphate isomerase